MHNELTQANDPKGLKAQHLPGQGREGECLIQNGLSILTTSEASTSISGFK
jgi:hypothetical protein